jgi:glycosyltransferase involved in cell wall biosynthesis
VGRPGRWIAAAYSLCQSGRLRQFEAWACATADAVTAVSDQDAAALRRLAPDAVIDVIPNFIDVEQYGGATAAEGEAFDLVFTGKMDYRPNVDAVTWFARAVWPAIRAARPGTTLAIVGQKPAPAVGDLERRAGITVTGAVDAVQPYLNAARVYVAPIRMASGTRLKLLEAMASGRAIVSTTAGCEGFPITDGRELIVADAESDFALAVQRLLDDPERRQALGDAARAFAAGYDWREVVPRFAVVYERLLKAEAAAASGTG